MNRSLCICGALGGLSLAVTLSAQEPGANSATVLTPEGALTLRSIADLHFAPDGNKLAFVVTEPPNGQDRRSHIWLWDKKTDSARQFTFSGKSESAPRWSPDGRQLAFLSNREESQQIYLMQADGGEASAVTKGKRDIQSFEWSPDGRQIAFLAPDAKTAEQDKKDSAKDDAHVVDKEDKRARLWLLNVASTEVRALTPATWRVSEICWAPAGDFVYVAATDTPASDQWTGRILGVAVADGSTTQIAAPRGPFRRVQVAPNGKSVSFIASPNDGPEPHDLWLQPVGGGVAQDLTAASLDRPIEDYQWLKQGSIIAVAVNGFRNLLVGYTAQHVRRDPSMGVSNPGAFALSGSTQIAYVGQTATEPEEVWLSDQQAAPRKLSHVNETWKHYTLVKPEFYTYKSFDGMPIEAALLKPAAYDGKSRVPLIALIHGGPTGNWTDAIETWGQLLAARGWAVFYPNIRGSIGYGQKFIEANRGDWGGGDYQDVMQGVKDLEQRGLADSSRLGIGGWSYGGYMAEWAVTQSHDFKAAVSGAGMANLISEYGTEIAPADDEWYYSVPYEKATGFLHSSPFVYLKNAKTPTLILQGDADPIDPLGQSQELYRGLKRYGVETELVVYPREPHGFHEEKHLLDRLNRILAWYDKYLH